MKKFVLGVTVIALAAWLFCWCSDRLWQENFAANKGFYTPYGFSVKVTQDLEHAGEWKVSIETPGYFARWHCRGFKSNKEAVKTAFAVVDEYRDGGYDLSEWEKDFR
jgi:hypothetical protein